MLFRETHATPAHANDALWTPVRLNEADEHGLLLTERPSGQLEVEVVSAGCAMLLAADNTTHGYLSGDIPRGSAPHPGQWPNTNSRGEYTHRLESAPATWLVALRRCAVPLAEAVKALF